MEINYSCRIITLLFLVVNTSCSYTPETTNTNEVNSTKLSSDTILDSSVISLTLKRPLIFTNLEMNKSLKTSLGRTLQVLKENKIKQLEDQTKRKFLFSNPLEQWLKLEKTDSTLIEYKPCNGKTPHIEFRRDTVIINFTHESIGFIIGDIIELTEFQCKVFMYTTTRQKELKMIEMSITKNDIDDIGIFEWKMFSNRFQWVMTNNRLNYPFLFTKCDNEMVSKLLFNAINIDSLKQEITNSQ